MKRQKEEMKKKKEELKVKKSRPIKKSRRSVGSSSLSESSSESEEWAPSIATEEDIDVFEIFRDIDEDSDVAQQNTVIGGREEELSNEVEPVEESLKEDEPISLPAGDSKQSGPSNSEVDQAKLSPQRCVAEKTTTVEEVGRCTMSRKKLDE
ncbi:hypothetical protein GE061_005184 [Apolygus lucorum]|uniref:Uncharacterized protein n=1 Tax=Apolygus lucorum TaxID=248454 RepID=A0A8S9WWZ5_APOLU|nr:hypothetical protein GE061_005184 [Apolygus lucorum]